MKWGRFRRDIPVLAANPANMTWSQDLLPWSVVPSAAARTLQASFCVQLPLCSPATYKPHFEGHVCSLSSPSAGADTNQTEESIAPCRLVISLGDYA